MDALIGIMLSTLALIAVSHISKDAMQSLAQMLRFLNSFPLVPTTESFRLFLQKFYYVGAVVWISDVIEHVYARNECLGIGQPFVEGVLVPDDARSFECIGVRISRLRSRDAAEHTFVAWA